MFEKGRKEYTNRKKYLLILRQYLTYLTNISSYNDFNTPCMFSWNASKYYIVFYYCFNRKGGSWLKSKWKRGEKIQKDWEPLH